MDSPGERFLFLFLDDEFLSFLRTGIDILPAVMTHRIHSAARNMALPLHISARHGQMQHKYN